MDRSSASAPLLRADHRRRCRPCRVPRPRKRALVQPDGSVTGRAGMSTSSCTPTRPTRSSTAPRVRRSWSPAHAVHGYPAMALTDHDGLWGSMEFAHACKGLGIQAITGAELTVDDGSHLTLLVESRAGYRNLCRLITLAHEGTRDNPRERTAPKLSLGEIVRHSEGLICLSGCAREGALAARVERGDLSGAERIGRRLAGRLRPGTLSGRAPAAVLAPRPHAQPRARAARRATGRAVRRDRQRARASPRPRPPAGRVRRGAPALDARPDRARAARQLELRDGVAGRDGGALSRPPGCAARDGADCRALRVRPHARPRLPLSRLGGPRRRPQAGRALPGEAGRALCREARARRGRRAASRRSCA